MERIFPWHLTGSGDFFSLKSWFWCISITLGNALCLAIYVAAVLLTVKAVW